MHLATKAAFGLAMIALAACNNPSKNGANGVVDPGGAYGDGSVTQGSINDPNSPAYFSASVGDTVNFLAYIGEPAQLQRRALGVPVIAFLIFFTLLAYAMKKEYWKDVK